jgi:hypothetical protein
MGFGPAASVPTAAICHHGPVPDSDAVRTRLDIWLSEAEARLDRLEARLPDEHAVAPADASPNGAPGSHVVFVPSPNGYALVEREGAAPAPGETVVLEHPGGAYAVTKVAASPMPGDARRCAYLQPV